MQKYSATDLQTYVVWLPMLPSDARNKWPPTLITGENVQHYWDGDQVIGKWFTANAKACKSLGPVAWDAFYLFDGDAKWEDKLDTPMKCGAAVIRERDALAEGLETLFPDKN